ncbi:MAG: hypothetical protein ACXU8Z_17450 [Caulobacteraceae bacterium]
MSAILAAAVSLILVSDRGCLAAHTQAECDAQWNAIMGAMPNQQRAAGSQRGLTVQSWHPDDWTTCTETRHGAKVTRAITYVGDNRSSYTSHPSPTYWKAMGCEAAKSAPTTPATFDSVMARFKDSEADSQRREARAVAKGIQLCKTVEEFSADPADCMRRARLADAP